MARVQHWNLCGGVVLLVQRLPAGCPAGGAAVLRAGAYLLWEPVFFLTIQPQIPQVLSGFLFPICHLKSGT